MNCIWVYLIFQIQELSMWMWTLKGGFLLLSCLWFNRIKPGSHFWDKQKCKHKHCTRTFTLALTYTVWVTLVEKQDGKWLNSSTYIVLISCQFPLLISTTLMSNDISISTSSRRKCFYLLCLHLCFMWTRLKQSYLNIKYPGFDPWQN